VVVDYKQATYNALFQVLVRQECSCVKVIAVVYEASVSKSTNCFVTELIEYRRATCRIIFSIIGALDRKQLCCIVQSTNC